MHLLSWVYWNPQKIFFTLPLLDRPIAWYGIWFAVGFIIAYFMLIPIVQQRLVDKSRQRALYFVDHLTWFVVLGTIIGARLGHVFFYEWPYFQKHPEDIIKVWEGGLASHGGTIGVFIALFLFLRVQKSKYPEYTFLALLDDVVIPTGITACCIRIGNFFNQEIIGTPTNVPWAIIFGHPADGSSVVPRHPAQLYEAGVYLLTFFVLYGLWKTKRTTLRPGVISGLFFIIVFGSRFFLEFLKVPQTHMIDESFLQTGQYLSLPMIAGGILLLFYSRLFEKKN